MGDTISGRCQIIKDWPAWPYEIHAEEKQIARQGQAMHYPFEVIVDRESQTGRFSSVVAEGMYYHTTLDSCDCELHQDTGMPCKHIYRLAVELGVIKIINRKPVYDKEQVAARKARNVAIKQSDDIDAEPEQLKRQKSAMSKKCTPVEVNHEAGTGIFAGSGISPYEVTVDTCTCRDYAVRRLPCKHIYRLRYELNREV